MGVLSAIQEGAGAELGAKCTLVNPASKGIMSGAQAAVEHALWVLVVQPSLDLLVCGQPR